MCGRLAISCSNSPCDEGEDCSGNGPGDCKAGDCKELIESLGDVVWVSEIKQ